MGGRESRVASGWREAGGPMGGVLRQAEDRAPVRGFARAEAGRVNPHRRR